MNRLIALFSGAILPLSLAPFNWWGLGIAAMAGLAFSLRTANGKQAFFIAWLFATASFATGVSWVYVAMHHFGQVPTPLAIIMTAAFCTGLGLIGGLFGYAYTRFLRREHGVHLLGFAAAWLLIEWLRSWIFTGFPWLYVGYSHLHSPLAGWAPVLGIHGLNFFTALSGAAVAELLLRYRQGGV